MKSTFKIGQKIKEAWPIFKNNLAIFFLLLAFVFLGNAINYKDNLVLELISTAIGVFVMYMAIRFLISIVDKKEFNPFSKSSIPSLRHLWNFIKTYILYSIISIACIGIFIVPILLLAPAMIMTQSASIPLVIVTMLAFVAEIYFSTRLMFAVFISVDKNQGARKSIKESWKMTKGHFWNIFGKLLVIGLFMFVGFIALFVGALITYPMGLILIAMLYRHFQKGKEEIVTPIENKTEIVKDAELLRE